MTIRLSLVPGHLFPRSSNYHLTSTNCICSRPSKDTLSSQYGRTPSPLVPLTMGRRTGPSVPYSLLFFENQLSPTVPSTMEVFGRYKISPFLYKRRSSPTPINKRRLSNLTSPSSLSGVPHPFRPFSSSIWPQVLLYMRVVVHSHTPYYWQKVVDDFVPLNSGYLDWKASKNFLPRISIETLGTQDDLPGSRLPPWWSTQKTVSVPPSVSCIHTLHTLLVVDKRRIYVRELPVVGRVSQPKKLIIKQVRVS